VTLAIVPNTFQGGEERYFVSVGLLAVDAKHPLLGSERILELGDGVRVSASIPLQLALDPARSNIHFCDYLFAHK
jgi:hypothetical protein